MAKVAYVTEALSLKTFFSLQKSSLRSLPVNSLPIVSLKNSISFNSKRDLSTLKSTFIGSSSFPFSSRSLNQINIKQYQKMSFVPLSSLSTVGLTKPSPPFIPEIDFIFKDESPSKLNAELLTIAVFEESLSKDEEGNFTEPSISSLDQSLNGLITELSNEPDFKAKSGQSAVIRVVGSSFKRIAIIGLGKLSSSTEIKTWRTLASTVTALSKQAQVESVAVSVVSPEKTSPEFLKSAAASFVTGISISSFEDNRFKSESNQIKLRSVLISGLGNEEENEKSLFQSLRLASGYILTKQLVNSPPNVLTPVALAEVAEQISLAHSDVLTAKIMDENECRELGMGAYLGVASASSINPPRFIHLKYSPPNRKAEKKVALIGKGLTFDSGGYNIKAGAGSLIEWMKIDMGGAGAVLGAAKSIAAIQPEGIEVNFIIASCENMISGSGMRPGDILTASNGKTIEINNTDAEGRLTLADALVYACNLKVDAIVDIATLTGACAGALGTEIGGMFSDDEALSSELMAAAKSSGDKLCHLPLEEAYFEGLKSNVADMKNTGPRFGGPITAALFLKRFVDENVRWAHIDCAGCMYTEKAGGTGYGTILLAKWILNQA